MARCGCAGFGACNCVIGGTGSVDVTGTGGQSDPFVVVGPTLIGDSNAGFTVGLTGTGKSGNPWKLTVVPRVYTTAARPSATGIAGMMIYDSTLGKPIWSNGTAWRDATGTAV